MKAKSAFLALSLLSGIASADLQWEATEQVFHPKMDDTQVTATFNFVNGGDRAVTITDLRPSCGCTTTELSKKTYQPGEQGAVKATFVFGNRQGLQKKSISVTTDAPNSSVTTLQITAHIPEIIQVSPAMVCWKRDEGKAAKTISVKVMHPLPLKIVAAKPGSEQFVAQVRSVVDGREYEITVTPADTSKPVVATLDIQTDFPCEDRRVIRSYLLVR